MKKLLFFFFNFQSQFFFIDFENYIISKCSLIPTPCEKMSKNEQKITKLWPLQNSSPIILVQTIIHFILLKIITKNENKTSKSLWSNVCHVQWRIWQNNVSQMRYMTKQRKSISFVEKDLRCFVKYFSSIIWTYVVLSSNKRRF